MRHFINIVENVLREGRTVFPEEAYDIIHDYVTDGAWGAPDQWNEQFDELARLLPRPAHSETVFRVFHFTPEQVQQISHGGLGLEPRRYSSWTKSEDTLERLVFDRRSKGSIVVVRATIPAGRVLVDVPEFYEQHNLTHEEDWSNYVLHEQEVIIFGTGIDTITPDLVINFQPTVDDGKGPEPGDWFVASNGVEEEIGDVHPDVHPGGGVYRVTTASGDPAHVRLSRNGWVEVDW